MNRDLHAFFRKISDTWSLPVTGGLSGMHILSAVAAACLLWCTQPLKATEPDYLTITNSSSDTATIDLDRRSTGNNTNVAYSINSGTDPQQYTWQTDTNYVQGSMRDLDLYSAEFYHDAACTQPLPEEEIIAFLTMQQESSSDIMKNIHVKLVARNNKELAVYNDSPRYEFVSYKLEDEDKNEFECTPAAKPVVLTNDATSVTSDGAVLNGLVSSDGGLTVTKRGFCWGTASDNLANCTTAGSGTGAFSFTLTGLTASTTYYFQAYAANGSGTARGEVKSFTTEAPAGPTGSKCNHDWVLLWEGGPKWATVNIGASSETDAGNYYMYGDTDAGATCLWNYYPYKGSNKNTTPYTKYGYANDGLLELEAGDDAATQAWCEGWRTPTKAEMDDLKVYCNITYDASNKGIRYTSKTTGQSIFLPSAGYKGNGSSNGTQIFNTEKYGKYMTATSTKSPGSNKYADCYYLLWYTNSGKTALDRQPSTTNGDRYTGISVRAVCD